MTLIVKSCNWVLSQSLSGTVGLVFRVAVSVGVGVVVYVVSLWYLKEPEAQGLLKWNGQHFNYVLVYGPLTDQQVEKMKKFDMAIVGMEISDAHLKSLQSAGVIVVGYKPTTSIDQATPEYTGLLPSDYLMINGWKVQQPDGTQPDWIMDPRSTHYRQVVVDSIKKDVYGRGFDGVFLDTMDVAGEWAGYRAGLDLNSSTWLNLQKELLTSTAQLANEIKAANPGKVVVQNGGYRELINYSAYYIDFMMWEDYPYHLGTSDAWVNAKRENVINLSKQNNFKVITLRIFNAGDNAGIQAYYDNARSYDFIPYGAYNNYNTVNIDLVPPGITKTVPAPTPKPAPDTQKPSKSAITETSQ